MPYYYIMESESNKVHFQKKYVKVISLLAVAIVVVFVYSTVFYLFQRYTACDCGNVVVPTSEGVSQSTESETYNTTTISTTTNAIFLTEHFLNEPLQYESIVLDISPFSEKLLSFKAGYVSWDGYQAVLSRPMVYDDFVFVTPTVQNPYVLHGYLSYPNGGGYHLFSLKKRDLEISLKEDFINLSSAHRVHANRVPEEPWLIDEKCNLSAADNGSNTYALVSTEAHRAHQSRMAEENPEWQRAMVWFCPYGTFHVADDLIIYDTKIPMDGGDPKPSDFVLIENTEFTFEKSRYVAEKTHTENQ